MYHATMYHEHINTDFPRVQSVPGTRRTSPPCQWLPRLLFVLGNLWGSSRVSPRCSRRPHGDQAMGRFSKRYCVQQGAAPPCTIRATNGILGAPPICTTSSPCGESSTSPQVVLKYSKRYPEGRIPLSCLMGIIIVINVKIINKKL